MCFSFFQSMTTPTAGWCFGRSSKLWCWLPWHWDRFTTWRDFSKYGESFKKYELPFDVPQISSIKTTLRTGYPASSPFRTALVFHSWSFFFSPYLSSSKLWPVHLFVLGSYGLSDKSFFWFLISFELWLFLSCNIYFVIIVLFILQNPPQSKLA